MFNNLDFSLYGILHYTVFVCICKPAAITIQCNSGAIDTRVLVHRSIKLHTFFFYVISKLAERMTTLTNERQISTQQSLVSFFLIFPKGVVFVLLQCISKEEEIQIVIAHWIRTLNIKLGWISDFDKLVVNYVMFICFAATTFMFDSFCQSSKLLKTFTGHTVWVNSVDCSIFDNCQLICAGSDDHTVRVWNVENSEQIRSFDKHSNAVYFVKFSLYHYHKYRHDQQLQIFKEHTECITGIEFSPFNGGRYLCSGSADRTIRLWDVETSKSLHVFNGHEDSVWCVDISPLQNNNKNNNESNSIGVIGGNGYTFCSGSFDNTIRIWDIETTEQSIVLKGHSDTVRSVKYGSNELGIIGGTNTILSGSIDKIVRLWDIRSGQQIQAFIGHTDGVWAIDYSPFVHNVEVGVMSNVICSGSADNTIRFWDIRSNKNTLYIINGDKEDNGIYCLKFLQLKKKNKKIASYKYDQFSARKINIFSNFFKNTYNLQYFKFHLIFFSNYNFFILHHYIIFNDFSKFFFLICECCVFIVCV
ncbi:hypothetical protein RFI_06071 [Reticulomyxa filosa]|uniref:Uncharacterized protein n=1 Tax=Reticulomyxa filosa TaxID=46433 RepID=X6NYY4_RETFI|nr:hypothetical protein RFI_06071 [Reticulomyxa filosa]|eukprot:ETO31049.1 hypothetical protein RFI_06071 [Reticulomyxa filosa]